MNRLKASFTFINSGNDYLSFIKNLKKKNLLIKNEDLRIFLTWWSRTSFLSIESPSRRRCEDKEIESLERKQIITKMFQFRFFPNFIRFCLSNKLINQERVIVHSAEIDTLFKSAFPRIHWTWIPFWWLSINNCEKVQDDNNQTHTKMHQNNQYVTWHRMKGC